MKIRLILAFICIGCSLSQAQTTRSLNGFSKLSLAEKPFTLTGTFTNYQPGIDSFRYCKIVYNHLYKNNQQNHVTEITPAGKFNMTIPLNRPQELFFLFGDELIVFYGVPGTTLDMQVDLPTIKARATLSFQQQRVLPSPITFSGQYGQLNRECNHFRPVGFKVLYYKEHNARIDSLDQLPYKAYRLGKRQQMIDSLQVFNEKNNTSTEFRQLMTQYIRYHAAEDLLRYRWLHGMSKPGGGRVELSKEYLSFMEETPIDNDEALITEAYSNYLREYTNNLPMAYNATKTDTLNFLSYLKSNGSVISQEEEFPLLINKSQRNAAQQQWVDSFYRKYKLDYSDFNARMSTLQGVDSIGRNIAASTGRDLVIARKYNAMIERSRLALNDDQLAVLTRQINNPNISAQVQRDNGRLQDMAAGKMPAATHVRSPLQASSDKFFEELVKPYKGKVVYIDFWAPWCGPCMSEMPNSKDLQMELKGKEVVFLYIGISCTKQSWENTIKDKDIVGEHYFANDNEGKLLSDKFNISGIPHYVLVDKNGKVADDRAARPGSKEKLVRAINNLLKKS
ncbi:TlpA disulfide reductase family protein [Paraflavitalea sp. CAU 1676]|uniref:TlpA family protein disulfide reductase n=1 Tax=Paraflavitalea sp. CAU 1676 TaxID=3032598 RepID=UPI0023D9A82B|nr:TlpA disulfide reductase family protein [Paraflavitalea sp. CAU 1676]MDF2187117.1 TlpA disulfide reductase family protein [Paraflavitalea sp. CAU 1676]